MNDELRSLLERYRDGSLPWWELSNALPSYDIWNGWQDTDDALRPLRAVVGHLELLTHEIGEGFRDEGELQTYVEQALGE